MKILAISEAGYSSDLLLRMQTEGHQIRLWIKEKPWKDVYNGLLPKVDTWEGSVSWADLIFFDHSGMSDIWKLVKNVKPCFGGSEWADKLEKDRPYAHQLFKSIGLKEKESLRAKTIDEAIKHLNEHKGIKHVVKPVGKKVDSHHVIIGEDKDNKDAIALLEVFKEQGLQVDYLSIEEKKEGIEVGVSGWFIADNNGGGNWSGDININFEHKRLMAGYPEGVGPLCGEAGTAMRYDSRANPLFKRTLDKLRPELVKARYRGQIDISFIINDEGDFPLEATPRLGYPACMIELALQRNSFADLFMATARGDSNFTNQNTREWAIGVVCFMPGYPSNEEVDKRSVGIPIFGAVDTGANYLHFVEIEKKASKLVTCKGMGYPLVVTGTGRTIQDAQAKAYHVISNANEKRVRIPNMFYRNDIGNRVIRQQKDFERLGIFSKELKPDPVLLAVIGG